MNIREALVELSSKTDALKIANYIGNNTTRFDELLDLFLYDKMRITQRAAWILGHCADKHPNLIEPHLETLLTNLQVPKQTVAIKRNTIRILQEVDLPEELLGIAADCCFGFLADPKETIAVRVFSMTICYNICKKEPELAPELRLLIEEYLPHGSAGFKSRGKKILKALDKLEGD